MSHCEYIRDRTRNEFFSTMSTIDFPGKKLIVEKSLISILDLTFTFPELEKVGIVKIIEWTPGFSEDGDGVYIYLIRSLSGQTLALMTSLAGQIVANKRGQRLLFFVPFEAKLGLNRLAALGVDIKTGFVKVGVIEWLDCAVISDDVISMQIDEESLEDNTATLVAKLLGRVEGELGVGVGHVKRCKFEKINSIGTSGKFVCDLLLNNGEIIDGVVKTGVGRVGGITKVRGLFGDDDVDAVIDGEYDVTNNVIVGPISLAVFIDRKTDLFSLICSQFTYTSLVDELYGIANSRVKHGTDVVVLKDDVLYDEIRDVSVSQIG